MRPLRAILISACCAASFMRALHVLGAQMSWPLAFVVGTTIGVAITKFLLWTERAHHPFIPWSHRMADQRKPAQQLDLLQEFVTRGQNAQKSVDDIIKRFNDRAQPESTEDRDRRLKNLRANRRRRGRAEPD